MNTLERKMIPLKAAMGIIGIGDTKIREIIASDPTFPAYLIGGRWKIDVQKLDRWIEAHRAGAVLQAAAAPPRPRKRGRPKSTPQTNRVWDVITPGWTPGMTGGE